MSDKTTCELRPCKLKPISRINSDGDEVISLGSEEFQNRVIQRWKDNNNDDSLLSKMRLSNDEDFWNKMFKMLGISDDSSSFDDIVKNEKLWARLILESDLALNSKRFSEALESDLLDDEEKEKLIFNMEKVGSSEIYDMLKESRENAKTNNQKF